VRQMSQSVTIHVRVNGEKIETIQFTRDCTKEEVLSVFYAAADIPESEEVTLKLRGPENALLPIGPSLDGNTAENPYDLEVPSGSILFIKLSWNETKIIVFRDIECFSPHRADFGRSLFNFSKRHSRGYPRT
jgi:hypothetical protein